MASLVQRIVCVDLPPAVAFRTVSQTAKLLALDTRGNISIPPGKELPLFLIILVATVSGRAIGWKHFPAAVVQQTPPPPKIMRLRDRTPSTFFFSQTQKYTNKPKQDAPLEGSVCRALSFHSIGPQEMQIQKTNLCWRAFYFSSAGTEHSPHRQFGCPHFQDVDNKPSKTYV